MIRIAFWLHISGHSVQMEVLGKTLANILYKEEAMSNV